MQLIQLSDDADDDEEADDEEEDDNEEDDDDEDEEDDDEEEDEKDDIFQKYHLFPIFFFNFEFFLEKNCVCHRSRDRFIQVNLCGQWL